MQLHDHGIEVTIHTAAGPLNEHSATTTYHPQTAAPTCTAYVQAVDDATFWIETAVHSVGDFVAAGADHLGYYFTLDGVREKRAMHKSLTAKTKLPARNTRHGLKEMLPDGSQLLHRYRFAAMDLVEGAVSGDDGPAGKGKEVNKHLGEIEVKVIRKSATVVKGGDKKKNKAKNKGLSKTESSQQHLGSMVGESRHRPVPAKAVKELIKAGKGELSQSVQYGQAEIFSGPAPNAGNSDGNAKVKYLDSLAKPYATFKFLYRSERMSRSIAILFGGSAG